MKRGLHWLQVVGFEIFRRQDDPAATVLHSEVEMVDAVLMAPATTPTTIGRPSSAAPSARACIFSSRTFDGFHREALAAGGTSVIEPEDTVWGTRRCRVLDPHGQEWSAGTYKPGTTW